MAGLTENGLTIKRLPEILQDIVTKERELISSGVITSDDSVLGQMNTIIGSSLSQLWELSQSVNDNFNKDKAEGKNLDDLGNLIGVYRITSSASYGDVVFEAKDGTAINAGTIVTSPTTGYEFEVTTSETLSSNDALSATMKVSVVNNSTDYRVSVNGTDYVHASDATATALEIVTGLKDLVDSDGAATWTATVLANNDLFIETTDGDDISINVTPYISTQKVTKSVRVTCTELGPVVAPPNTVNQLKSPNSSIFSVTNPSDFVVGRLEESDAEYRKRFSISSAGGKATVRAITDNLFTVPGVSYVNVVENDSSTVDAEGRPPKSFEAIVQGGEDTNVAESVWETKPAGIEMYGNSSGVITDSYGHQRSVKFTRPSAVNLAVRVTYTIYDEETFPSDGGDRIKEAVLAHINSLGVDTDVIPTRIFGPIYSTVTGIDSLTVEVQSITTPGDPPVELNWQETKLAVGTGEYAQVTLGDIETVDGSP